MSWPQPSPFSVCHHAHLSLSLPLFFLPGTGFLSFPQSSIWTRSWQTRSKTIKTSWPLRAMRGRVSSLTWTACEWIGRWMLRVLLTVWMSVPICRCLCQQALYCLLFEIAELCYAGPVTCPFLRNATSIWLRFLLLLQGNEFVELIWFLCQNILE